MKLRHKGITSQAFSRKNVCSRLAAGFFRKQTSIGSVSAFCASSRKEKVAHGIISKRLVERWGGAGITF